jgi:ATP-binding cassette subfamily A (ABC1) protein 5
MLIHVVFAIGTTFLIIITGLIWQFDFFYKNNFFTYFFLLFFFGLSIVTLGFVAAAVLKKANQATVIGFLLFAVSFLFPFAVGNLYSDNTSVGYEPLEYILAFFSPVMLAKGLGDLSNAASNNNGLSFTNIGNNTSNFPLAEVYGFVVVDTVLYLLLALYLDNVLPREVGVRQPLHYFLTLSYWTGRVAPRPFHPSPEPNVRHVHSLLKYTLRHSIISISK